MTTKLDPIERWNSATGQRLLQRLAEQRVDPDEVFTRLTLPAWESALIRRALKAPRGFASRFASGRERAQRRRFLADVLDDLRANERRSPPLDVAQPAFRGTRAHLDRLARSVRDPTDESEWNLWRKRHRRIRPDLRGANLSSLRLQHLRLDSVRLSDANLSEAMLGGGVMDRADLRRTRWDRARLSDASLKRADLRDGWFQDCLMSDVDLQGADLRGTTLIGCSLNGANLKGADLRNAFVWGTSVWQVTTDSETRQANIGIGWDLFNPIDAGAFGVEREAKFDIRVHDIAVADFISLVSTNRTKLASILDAASSKLVLLLGRFQGKQKEVLNALEEELSEVGYVPIVFDFHEPNDRDLVETVSILAGLSRFVIADLTSPRSTPLESQLIIPNLAIPFAPIIREGDRPFSMFFALLRKYPWVLDPVYYRSVPALMRNLNTRILEPAEALARKLKNVKHPAGSGPV